MDKPFCYVLIDSNGKMREPCKYIQPLQRMKGLDELIMPLYKKESEESKEK